MNALPTTIDKPQPIFNPILEDPLLATGIRLALPLVATGFLSALIGIVDMWLAGLIGSDAQAAVGLADQILFMTVLVGTGLCTGVVACVSHTVGAGDFKSARNYARDGIILAVLVGLAASFIGYGGAGSLLGLFHCSEKVTADALPYLQYCSLANAPWLVALCQAAIFRAVGKTNYCLFMWTSMTAVSIVGSVLLFFLPGAPGFHALSALSYAWVGGAVSGVLVGCLLSRNISWTETLPLGTMNVDWAKRVMELVTIAAPAVVAELLWILSNFGMYRLLSDLPCSSDLQAAWTINLKLEEAIASVPLLGLGMAAATIAGQSAGARQFGRARAGGWQLAAVGAAFMVMAGGILQSQSSALAGSLTTSQSIAENVSLLLNCSWIGLPFLSVWLVLAGGLEGAGLTKLSLGLNLFGLLLVRIPLAWVLSHCLNLGLSGVWISVMASRLVMALLSVVVFAWFLRAPVRQTRKAV